MFTVSEISCRSLIILLWVYWYLCWRSWSIGEPLVLVYICSRVLLFNIQYMSKVFLQIIPIQSAVNKWKRKIFKKFVINSAKWRSFHVNHFRLELFSMKPVLRSRNYLFLLQSRLRIRLPKSFRYGAGYRVYLFFLKLINEEVGFP